MNRRTSSASDASVSGAGVELMLNSFDLVIKLFPK